MLSSALQRGQATALFAVSVLFGGQALAAGGHVTFASDDVTYERGGATMPLDLNSTVQTGDVIVTGETGRARIQMDDDSIIALAPRSRFSIDEYSYGGGESGKSWYSQLLGGFRTITGNIGKGGPASYQLKTPVATLGIRGTDYTTYMCVSGSCVKLAAGTPDGLHIRVRKGPVIITNAAGSVELQSGEFGFVADAHTAPVKVPPVPAIFLVDVLTDDLMFEAAAELEALGVILDFCIHAEVPVSPSQPGSGRDQCTTRR